MIYWVFVLNYFCNQFVLHLIKSTHRSHLHLLFITGVRGQIPFNRRYPSLMKGRLEALIGTIEANNLKNFAAFLITIISKFDLHLWLPKIDILIVWNNSFIKNYLLIKDLSSGTWIVSLSIIFQEIINI